MSYSRNADDVRDELHEAWDCYYRQILTGAITELTDDQLGDLLRRFRDWERKLTTVHTEYDPLAGLLCWPIATELLRRRSAQAELESHVVHDGHNVWIDHDELNRDRPFLASCSCFDDDEPWGGPYPLLVRAMESVADHLEANGLDRHRDCDVFSDVLTAAEVERARETFLEADRGLN